MSYKEPGLNDIYLARRNIKHIITHTPLLPSPQLSKQGSKVYLKLESLQNTGSFKLRGAANKISTLTREERARGVITVSSGNHGRAVSYLSRELGVKAVVCVSEAVPKNKVDAIHDLGAEVIISGKTYDEATENALNIQAERQLTFIHPFDDFYIIAGQGTIALELMEDLPETDTVVVPLSGGGLLCGIAVALKTINPDIHTVGATMDRGAAVHESLKAGRIVEVKEYPTIADALPGGLGGNNIYTFKMAQKYVDETVLVSEEQIADAIRFAMENHRLVIEGGAAVGIAALMQGKISNLGKNVAVIISGGNLDLGIFKKVFNP